MSLRRQLLASSVFAGLILCGHAQAAGPGLGQDISDDELSAWDISIEPNGKGLPPGSGSVSAGADVYAAKCAQCHGETGTEGPTDPLAGGIGSLATEAPAKTVGSFWPYATTLFDYTRRAMPLDAPQSLTADETYAVTAYVLHLNDIVEEDAVLDAASLPGSTCQTKMALSPTGRSAAIGGSRRTETFMPKAGTALGASRSLLNAGRLLSLRETIDLQACQPRLFLRPST